MTSGAKPGYRVDVAWTPATALARGWVVLRRDGPRGLVARVLAETCYRQLLLLDHGLDRPLPPITPRRPAAIHRLGAEDIPEYLLFRADTSEAEIRARLARDMRCCVARHQGRIVSAIWATRHGGWIGYLERDLHTGPDTVLLSDSFTEPAHRGNRFSPAVVAELLRGYAGLGCHRAVTLVRPDNEASLRARQALGFRPRGRLRTVWIGRRRWHFGDAP
jgi:RimJ/RimL family protein N-acetyltransferase